MPHFALKQTLDISGAIFSLLSTLLYVKADQRAWPVGLVAILINMTLYLLTGLYGDSSLEFIYLVSTFYGWYQWTRGDVHQPERAISRLSFKHGVTLLVLGTIGFLLTVYCLEHFTHSKVPYWDASTTILSLIAQWLICRKIFETWIVWFIVDALYVGLYFYKGIPAHSILAFVYSGTAVAGYWRWRYQLSKQARTAAINFSPGSTLGLK